MERNTTRPFQIEFSPVTQPDSGPRNREPTDIRTGITSLAEIQISDSVYLFLSSQYLPEPINKSSESEHIVFELLCTNFSLGYFRNPARHGAYNRPSEP